MIKKLDVTLGSMYYVSAFKIKICTLFIYEKAGWIRFGLFAISWRHISKWLLFSERIGKKKYLRIFNYTIRIV